jgi:hypothetical protein
MNMKQVKDKAKTLDLKPGRMKKAELILAIQTAEGNSPCFETARDECDQAECCWREDCVS